MLRPDLDRAFQAVTDLDLTFDSLGFPRHLGNFRHLLCGKACKDDPLGGKSASSLTHLVWLQKLLFVVQRWKGKRG